MDTTFSAQDLEFQKEVRDFLASNYDDALKSQLSNKETYKAGQIEWQQRLFRKGWIAPSWPAEYGGCNWSSTQKFIYENERALAGAPDVLPFGLKMVGPVIYSFGTQEQKDYFLPKILNSEHWWCQGYSEPGAGSDLAALKTKATLDGDHYVVNGAKIWTTYAQAADWIFCLVRTNSDGKKQQGISFLLIDMKSEGITVNPIIGIDNCHTLNEVVFDNVRVPVSNLIGEQDKGWTYAKSLLAHERTSIAGVADSKRNIAQLKELAADIPCGDGTLLSDGSFAKKLSDIEIELSALEYTELRVLAQTANGGHPGPESSLLKIKGTEIQQAIQRLRMDMAGPYIGVQSQDYSHPFADKAREQYMYGRATTVYGGSNEVQKNIIAKFVLGL